MLLLIVFYSAVSVGFSSSVQNTSNLALFDACFNYLSLQRELSNYAGNSLSDSSPEHAMDELYLPPLNEIPAAQADSTDTPGALKDTTNILDSLSVSDSLSTRADSTEVDSLARFRNADSTARIKNFTHERKDYPNVKFGEKTRQSGFYVYPSARRKIIEIDSTGEYVIIKEVINDDETRIRLKIPFDEYIKIKLRANQRDEWEKLAYEYEVKNDKKSLESLITDITNIEIPLPSSALLSIFGPPKINLRIGGAVDIHGAWRNETTEGLTTSAYGNSHSEPDFKQQVQINVDGTIGDKLTIGADWNTERTFEYENQLKIKYTGYPDEIVQSVEAGNVSLQTSSLVGGGEALFGIKANFQMGPLTLTALASQKKGEIKEMSITSGSQSQTFELHAYDYSTNHYFIDSVYADSVLNLFNNYYFNATPEENSEYYVKKIEVWKSLVTAIKNPDERNVIASLDLPLRGKGQKYFIDITDGLDTTDQNAYIRGRFIKLTEGTDYIIHRETGFITFKTQVNNNEAIAIAYQREGASGEDNDIIYGEFAEGQDLTRPLLLKLVKPKDLNPENNPRAWKLMLKNIYPVGGKDINEEGFDFNIYYQLEGNEPQPVFQDIKLLNAFALDRYNDQKTYVQEGDQKFDYLEGKTIIPATGEVVFPMLQPFGRDLPSTLPDTLKYPEVYSKLSTIAKQSKTKDKFLLKGKYTGTSSNTYSIGFSAVENSVRVYLNGNQLKENVDYTVDYTIGKVVIRNSDALVAGADLRITYEQNDLFQLASKTLLGLRGVVDISNRTKLGFSALSLNQETLTEKVRIGEEPLSNSIYGVDFTTGADLPFLTKALDNVISTNTMSTLDFRGEFAYINPDPNTKKSPISGDDSKSIAYLDDFEGVKRIIPIGVYASGWKDLSVPDNMPGHETFTKDTSTNYKGNTYWYNLNNVYQVNSIWGLNPDGTPRKQAGKNESQVTVLELGYNPHVRGQYNYNQYYHNTPLNWGGTMKVLSSSASNLLEDNVEYIEFWAWVKRAPAGSKMYIDLGKISEDVIPNGATNTEDKNRNSLLDEGEDLGIDGVADVNEPGYDAVTNPDPANDNFDRSSIGSGDYSRYNKSQGNLELLDLGGRFPDTEDLNNNGSTDLVNSYFRYEVPLDTSLTQNPFIVGGGYTAFYQFRVPLKEFKEKIGNPSFSSVEYIRIWFEGAEDTIHVSLAELNLIGNQWQKIFPVNAGGVANENDSVMTVSVVSVEDNSPVYYSPPGVEREKDRSSSDEEIVRNEQSMELKINGLKNGDHREAVKYLTSTLDVFNYKEMKFFLHGDEGDSASSPVNLAHYISEENYNSEVYFRFGADTNNYYEYRQPIQPGWNEVKILFEDLTALKQSADSTNEKLLGGGAAYQIKGKPALTRISFYMVGIRNVKDKGTEQSIYGTLWVNELRVLGADDHSGWAYTGSASFKLADLMSVNVNMSRTDPYFHKLSDRFGSRTDTKSWGASVDLDALKLLPFKLPGSNLRVNYSRTESISNPLYVSGTDILISSAASQLEQNMLNEGYSAEEAAAAAKQLRTESQTVNVSNTLSLSQIKIKLPTDYWLIRDSFNSLTFGFSYNNTTGRNPNTLKNRTWVWNASVNYGINLSPDYYFYPADIPVLGTLIEIFSDYRNVKFFYTPQNVSSGVTAKRSFSYSQIRPTTSSPNPTPSISRDFQATRNMSFGWKFTEGGFINPALTYSSNASSSLLYLLTEGDIERSESEIWNDIFTGTFFGRDYSYGQSVDLKTSPRLPALWDISKYLTLTAGYRVNYSWNNNFAQEVLGRSAGYSNNINAGITIKLKSLFDPLFQDVANVKMSSSSSSSNTSGRNRNTRNRNTTPPPQEQPAAPVASDSTQIASVKSDSVSTGGLGLTRFYLLLKKAFHWTLIDYESISLNFSQDNTFSGNGLYGRGNGFSNFWGVSYDPMSGPSRSFMLGLSNDIGARAPNGNLSNSYTQRNNVDFSTSRPLWEGAQIKLKWNVGWSMSKTTKLTTDDYGNVNITSVTSTGNLSRSFFSLPPVFIFSMFKSGIKKVFELYDPNDNSSTAMQRAFVEGFESFPLISKVGFLKDFANFIPRPNWEINWDGLEKFSLFESFAKKVSLNHIYSSGLSESWNINTDGSKNVTAEKINYGFAPLLGLSITFNSFWDGNMTGSIRYSTKSAYDLAMSSRSITESYTSDIGVTASYSKSGFEWPLFGVSLKNDIEVSFSYTKGTTSSVQYSLEDENENGEPLDGTVRTSLEPRLKYVVSSKVTLSVFYKRTSVEPEGASRITPTTTNEAGLDIHISIQ